MSNAARIVSVLDGLLTKEAKLIIYGRAAIALGFENPPQATLRSLDVDALLSPSCEIAFSETPEFWDAQDGRRLGPPLRGHEGEIGALVFSPDGRTLASVGWGNGWLGVWDVAGRRERGRLRGHHGAVFKAAFSPDGNTIATCGSDETVRLWNLASLQEVAVLRGHRGDVRGVAFSPDGHWLASASSDGTLRLWRAPAFDEIANAARPRQTGLMD